MYLTKGNLTLSIFHEISPRYTKLDAKLTEDLRATAMLYGDVQFFNVESRCFRNAHASQLVISLIFFLPWWLCDHRGQTNIPRCRNVYCSQQPSHFVICSLTDGALLTRLTATAFERNTYVKSSHDNIKRSGNCPLKYYPLTFRKCLPLTSAINLHRYYYRLFSLIPELSVLDIYAFYCLLYYPACEIFIYWLTCICSQYWICQLNKSVVLMSAVPKLIQRHFINE